MLRTTCFVLLLLTCSACMGAPGANAPLASVAALETAAPTLAAMAAPTLAATLLPATIPEAPDPATIEPVIEDATEDATSGDAVGASEDKTESPAEPGITAPAPGATAVEAPTSQPEATPTPPFTATPESTLAPDSTLTPEAAPEVGSPPVESGSEATDGAESDAVARGKEIFGHGLNGAPPCSGCHLVREGQVGFSLGPNLAGVSERAAARVEGLDVDAYLHESIQEPSAFLVPGYRGLMYPDYGKLYAESDLLDLIAYLKSL